MELSFKDFKELIGVNEDDSHPYRIGEKYLIRTVTMIYTGKLKSVYKNELVITGAAWVADTGRFAEALEKGKLNEVEVYPEGDVIVGRGAIVDVAVWCHPLPRETK